MQGLNRVLLIGNLTRDPVTRATPGGTPICELGLAMNRRYRTAAGQEGEDTCFVDIDVFGAQADSCARYLRKGSLAYVEGRLRLDQWQDKTSGDNRSRLKIVAERVQFLDTRRDDGGRGGDGQYQRDEADQGRGGAAAPGRRGHEWGERQDDRGGRGPGGRPMGGGNGAVSFPDDAQDADPLDATDDIPF